MAPTTRIVVDTNLLVSRLLFPDSVPGQAVQKAEREGVVLVSRDAGDDKFLELALSGDAALILTGDADLLVLNPFCGIAIRTASDWLLAD